MSLAKRAHVAPAGRWGEGIGVAHEGGRNAEVRMSTLYQGLVLALGMVIAMAPVCAEPPVTLTNSLGMELVRIPPGTFMGSDPLFDTDASKDELPWHRVTISKPFCLGKYEVTQGQWVAVMGKNPAADFRGRTMPVDLLGRRPGVHPQAQRSRGHHRLPPAHGSGVGVRRPRRHRHHPLLG